MKKLRFGLLAILLVFSVTVFTGCANVDIVASDYSDGTGEADLTAAVSIDLLNDGTVSSELIEKTIMDIVGDLTEEEKGQYGVEYNADTYEYHSKGFDYRGTVSSLFYNNPKGFINEKLSDVGVEIRELPNGNMRMECRIIADGHLDSFVEELPNVDINDMEQLRDKLYDTNGFVNFSFLTDYEVVDHNASIELDCRYTWSLLDFVVGDWLTQEDKVLWLEYKDPSVETGSDQQEQVDTDLEFYANELYELGIIKGTNKGLELDKTLTRAEGAVMYSRMLGLEQEIEKFEEDNQDYVSRFADVPTWAAHTIDYLYDQGLVMGISDTKYGSDDLMTETQFATLILRALGYDDQKGEFSWDEAYEFARDIGLYDGADETFASILGDNFNRCGMAYMSYNALHFGHKDSGEKLIDSLF
ncbi:MAG TPA: hypothetical protein VFD15_01785 [Clostridia bacterium]|nr:hypothetical protein [Clostridia bacterium]